MLQTAIDDLIVVVKTITDFPTGSVARGEFGKVNSAKSAGCLVVPDFGTPTTFSGDVGELAKQLPFQANLFIYAAQKKTLEAAENEVMDLVQKVIYKINDTESLLSMNGNQKYFHWELTGIEWQDRSASLCVIALEFTVYLQL